MGFGVRNECEELNELMKSTDTNIINESPERNAFFRNRPNMDDKRF